MSARFLKLLSALVAILSLVPTVAAAPIPLSSPTAIALIVYLSVVPASLILLLAVKYFYVKHRKLDVVRGHTLSSRSPSQLPFLVGLLGSPDWEIKRKASEHTVFKDTNSQFSFPSVGHRSTSRSIGQRNKFRVFHRLGRTPWSSGLRSLPVVASISPPDQSFFYALDSPASSTQSSLGNLLPDSALVRLVSGNSQNQLVESPGYLSKGMGEIPTLAHNSVTSPSSFNQLSPEVRSPPKVKRCTLTVKRRTPPILPIQTPPDSLVPAEPKGPSPSGNFSFHLRTPEPSTAHRHTSHPFTQSQPGRSTSAVSGFPRSPSQEFHTCDERSPGPGLGNLSPPSPSTSPIHRFLGKVTSNVKLLSPSLFVNVSGGSPLLTPVPENQQGLTVPRRGGAGHMEDNLGEQSPTVFVSSSANAMIGAKLVPFSASARASVVSESPSYNSEYAYQGGASPTVPYELEGYYDYTGPEAVLPVYGKTESPEYRNGRGQASSSTSDVVSYAGGGNLEPSSPGPGRSFCVPGLLFPIPEEDTQAESSGSRTRSDPSMSLNGSGWISAADSLPLTSSSYGEFAVSFVSASGSFRVVDHSTPGASGAGRSTHTTTGYLPITSATAQATRRGTNISGTSPPNVNTLRIGARESYPGSGDLNDGTEMSGACMNGLYEELEEWGCEWILQNQPQQSGPSIGRTPGREVGTAL